MEIWRKELGRHWCEVRGVPTQFQIFKILYFIPGARRTLTSDIFSFISYDSYTIPVPYSMVHELNPIHKKLNKDEIFIKHKIQSASAFYQSVTYPNFIAYVAKDALIGPKNRAIFLIELICSSDKDKAVYAFNQVFGSCDEDDLRDEPRDDLRDYPYMSLEDILQPYDIEITIDETPF